jgi:release factor glutamine methyltransferase
LTLQQSLSAARARLVAAGLTGPDAAADADLLARTALGWDRARLIAELTQEVPASLEPTFSSLIERRARREPTAYIVGTREFWGLDFRVTPAVLIPRPETENIVSESLALLRDVAGPRIADIGTGSGCLAVSLAHERPDARIWAIDVSADALLVAADNAARHRVADRITFVHTRYLDGVDETFDLIASNPPYVRERDRRALSPDVRHEPDAALYGGDEGLDAIGGVLDAALSHLRPHGWCVMEFGFGQGDEVERLIGERSGLALVRIVDDLQGIPRTAVMQRRADQ